MVFRHIINKLAVAVGLRDNTVVDLVGGLVEDGDGYKRSIELESCFTTNAPFRTRTGKSSTTRSLRLTTDSRNLVCSVSRF